MTDATPTTTATTMDPDLQPLADRVALLIQETAGLYADPALLPKFWKHWMSEAAKEMDAVLNHEHITDDVKRYTGKLNTQRLMNYVRDLSNKSVSKKNYNMRIAPEDDSLNLTGFEKGGVTPLGMKTANIPIILHESITKLRPPVLYLGAGHVDWKVAMPVQDFVRATGCFVADLD
ncbi:hypothetical protein HDV05_002822 [Chytridiales sp. JEL 0842]|nr:hypothetical protein HDV05_002822 [Chytridiales sp. JEL 0842]